MIMGDTCTRACAFCNVKTGLPNSLDQNEPVQRADATAPAWPCTHCGYFGSHIYLADWWGAAFGRHHTGHPRALSGYDDRGAYALLLRKAGALEIVVGAKPDVFNHNLETVPSLFAEPDHNARLGEHRSIELFHPLQ